MKKITSVLVFSILFTGCVDGRFHKRDITGGPCAPAIPMGYTYTGIAYGESKMVVIPISTIKAGNEWRFYLAPIDSLGGATQFENAQVKIVGKPAGSISFTSDGASIPYVLPSPPADDSWLVASGTYKTAKKDGRKRYIDLCVSPDVDVGQDWQYLVEIETVGTLDPRGHVER